MATFWANFDNLIKSYICFFKVLIIFLYVALSDDALLKYVMSQQYMEVYTNVYFS